MPDRTFELLRRDPHRHLGGLVRRYTGFSEHATAPVRRREMPSGDVVLILDLGSGWRIFDPDDPGGSGQRHGSFVAGLDDRAGVVQHDGDACCLQVDLTPLGARALLGVPMHELAGRICSLDEIAGREGKRIVEQLGEARDWSHRFALLDGLLARRAENSTPPRPDVAWAWRRLEDTRGAIGVGELAAELHCSRRHLAARFNDEIGLAPKRAARLLRFRHAVTLMHGGGAADSGLAAIAASCGYFDQAHFNRDFKAFAGVTPTQLLAETDRSTAVSARGARPSSSGAVKQRH